MPWTAMMIWYDICINDKPIYLFQGFINIIKNIRNNLLNRKKLTFYPFSSNCLKYFPLEVNGAKITWALLHKVHEEDQQCLANLRAAPKLITLSFTLVTANRISLVHLLCLIRQLFLPYNISYYPENHDSHGFLYIIYVWWIYIFRIQKFNLTLATNWAMLSLKAMVTQISLGNSLISSKNDKFKKSRSLKILHFQHEERHFSSNVAMSRNSHWRFVVRRMLSEETMDYFFYLHII